MQEVDKWYQGVFNPVTGACGTMALKYDMLRELKEARNIRRDHPATGALPELAQCLAVSRLTISKLAKSERIPCFRIGTRSDLIRELCRPGREDVAPGMLHLACCIIPGEAFARHVLSRRQVISVREIETGHLGAPTRRTSA